MKRKQKLSLIIFLVFIIALAFLTANIVISDAVEKPLEMGERFGPTIHEFSRIFPIELSNKQSSSFQGLNTPRAEPDRVLVYNIGNLTPEEKIQAAVVQGIMNRKKPTLYLMESEHDSFWLSQIDVEKQTIANMNYSKYPKIKYSPSSLKQKYLAITLSGVHDAIPSTTAEKPLIDLTEMSDSEIYSLMIETFNNNCSKSIISFRDRQVPSQIDFVVKNKILLSPLAITEKSILLDLEKESIIEAQVMEEIFSKMEPDCAMVGYNINPKISGEFETINYLSEKGCFSIPAPDVPNLSFFSGFPKKEPKHKTPKSEVEVENKTYVTILMSDGDNLELPFSKYENFKQPHENPIAWSMSPFLNEFAPTIFNYYSSQLAEQDSFVVAPSGAGFGYPAKNKYLPAFINHTEKFMKESNLEYIWIIDYPLGGYSPSLLSKFAEISKGIFMEYSILRSYDQSIEMYNETPAVFSAGFVEKDGKIAERIVKSTPNDVPAFIFIGVEMRYNSPKHIDSEISKLPAQYEVVSVPEFTNLIKKHSQKQ